MSWRVRQLVRHGLVEWYAERGAAGPIGSSGNPALGSGVVTSGGVVTASGMVAPGAFPSAWLGHSQRLRDLLLTASDVLMGGVGVEGGLLTENGEELCCGGGFMGGVGMARSAERGGVQIREAARGTEEEKARREGRESRGRGSGGKGGERGTDGEGEGEGGGEGGREGECEEEGAEVEEVEGTDFEEGTEKLLREMERELSTIEQVVWANSSTGKGGVVVAKKERADSGSDSPDERAWEGGQSGERIGREGKGGVVGEDTARDREIDGVRRVRGERDDAEIEEIGGEVGSGAAFGAGAGGGAGVGAVGAEVGATTQLEKAASNGLLGEAATLTGAQVEVHKWRQIQMRWELLEQMVALWRLQDRIGQL
ncbi:unnamed protein product [Closterium sp. NIES-54]